MNLERAWDEAVQQGLRLFTGLVIFAITLFLMPKAGEIGAIIGVAGMSYAIGRGIFPPKEKEEHED